MRAALLLLYVGLLSNHQLAHAVRKRGSRPSHAAPDASPPPGATPRFQSGVAKFEEASKLLRSAAAADAQQAARLFAEVVAELAGSASELKVLLRIAKAYQSAGRRAEARQALLQLVEAGRVRGPATLDGAMQADLGAAGQMLHSAMNGNASAELAFRVILAALEAIPASASDTGARGRTRSWRTCLGGRGSSRSRQPSTPRRWPSRRTTTSC